MPRPKKLIPSYRRHGASGQAVVCIAGRTHYLGPHGTQASLREYDRVVAEWLARGRTAEPPQDAALTVSELCARYLPFAREYYRKDGRCTKVFPAIRIAARYLREWYGRSPAEEFGPLALKAIRQRMVDEGHSRRYVNDHMGRIKRMFKWGASEQLVPPETYQALALVPGLRKGKTEAHETAPVLPVDEAAVDATLPHLSTVVADMVRLQRFTGMRPAEVCSLRPCDLDRSEDVWVYTPAGHKTEHHGRERIVLIGPRGRRVLTKYLKRGAEEHCFRPRDAEAERRARQHAARVVPLTYGNRPGTNRKERPKRGPGERYDTDSYRRAIHRACDKAFPHPPLENEKDLADGQLAELRAWRSAHRWSPNRLRHAAATEVRKRFGIEAAQVVLGHASAGVTEIYAERDLARGVEVARAIG